MKTDELIEMLSTNVEPVDQRQVGRTLVAAILVGAAAALAIMLLILGVRSDLWNGTALAFLFLKLAFTGGLVVLASIYLERLSRPGGERRTSVVLATLPFGAIMLLGLLSLVLVSPAHWNMMIAGDQWLQCLISIPIIAVVPFAVIILAVRQAAPTDLVRAGALAGLAAGGVSAMGYALHCTDDYLPFVALWYGGTIALCAFVGAKLGPRLLRW